MRWLPRGLPDALARISRALRSPAVEATVALERHGSDYGGWCIPVGSLGPESLVYSAGIGEDTSFEESLADAYGCRMVAIDPTPRAVAYIGGRNIPRVDVVSVGLGGRRRVAVLHRPRHPEHVSGSLLHAGHLLPDGVEVAIERVGDIMERRRDTRIDLLKMDIEGAEYEVIDDLVTSGTLACIGMLLIEFHHRFEGVGMAQTRRALRSLRRQGFHIAWISPGGDEFLLLTHWNPGRQ